MKVFFVSYDLRKDKNYKTLYDELNQLKAIRVLESLWSLKLDEKYECSDIREHFLKFIDEDDGIIVFRPTAYATSKVDNAPHKFD